MRRTLIALFVTFVTAAITFKVLADCGSYFQPEKADTFSGGPCPNSFSKTAHWHLFFTDGHETSDVQVTANGACYGPPQYANNFFCYPGYDTPYWMSTTVGKWNQQTHAPSTVGSIDTGFQCYYSSIPITDHIYTYNCKAQCNGETDFTNYFTTGCITGFTAGGSTCGRSSAFINKCFQYDGDYDSDFCVCTGCGSCGGSPILIDLSDDGFHLTNATEGVDFDLKSEGATERIGWTTFGSDDAWLTLDRNNNGIIDNGRELFGDLTPQPPSSERNGFRALAVFDTAENGGNHDGVISRQDTIFSSLRLWQDINHNGISESSELHTLEELGIKSVALQYETVMQKDEYGNQFRYRGKVKGTRDSQPGRWAWDVFLTTKP